MCFRGRGAGQVDQGSGNVGDRGWPPTPEAGGADARGRSLRVQATAESTELPVWPHPLWRVGADLVQPATGPRREHPAALRASRPQGDTEPGA